MAGAEDLAESAKRIRRLVELVEAPARRDISRLAIEADPAKAIRVTAAAGAKSAEQHGSRYGWVPFLGGHLQAASKLARGGSADAEEKWQSLRIRARDATDLLKASKISLKSLSNASARAGVGGRMADALTKRTAELLARSRFLSETLDRDASRVTDATARVFSLAAEAGAIARCWDGLEEPVAPVDARGKARPTNAPAVSYGTGKSRRVQLALDFNGTGPDDGLRIWLPISSARAKEMAERGARIDRDAPRRGSQLWVPFAERAPLDQFLPLAFREAGTHFSFPPIRHNAVGQNLWSIFDKDSWSHIRTTAYDRAGHRCQICGKQGGGLWSRITPQKERAKSGPVDCHEVWSWTIAPTNAHVGVQKLIRLLILCKDCHLAHHDGFARSKAREAGIEDVAISHIRALRMLMNRCDGPTLDAQLSEETDAWDSMSNVRKWIIDLSHLAAQDFMADHTLVLMDDNKAGVSADLLAGISFHNEAGRRMNARAAQDIIKAMP